MFWPQKVCRNDHFLLRIPDDKGGLRNPSAPIGFNEKSATNFRSLSAMRGAEIHGNNRRDGTTRILRLGAKVTPGCHGYMKVFVKLQ